MTDNRLVQELRGALRQMLKACQGTDKVQQVKAVCRAERMLSVTHKEAKRIHREVNQ